MCVLQITKCNNDSTSYNIPGLQSYTQYTVGVTVCTIVGEGPMAMVPSGMTMTLPGTPAVVENVTPPGNTMDSVLFSWSAAQFNDRGGNYQVSS